MSVRAKFRVARYETTMSTVWHGNTPVNEQEVRTIVLRPVYDQDKESENGKFFAATPSGEIKLGTVNPHAWKQFELGKEYFVTFELAAGS